MRLTLRTLLAYMDEILEPADREELAKKVESSEFAHDLIHRTKDTMRRLRLSAPQVVGTGMALDPNTVAEYLDNALPPDSVADFERICLESDVHLAEVASAHHVLTMVLGEPAEVDPAARQRMYGLPAEAENRKHHRIEPAHSFTPPAAAHDYTAPSYAAVTPPPHVFPPASVTPVAPRAADEAIPDYLRASSWTTHGTLIGACAAVLLAAVGWLLYTGMSGWSGGPQQAALAPSNDSAKNLTPPAEPPLEAPEVPAEAAVAATTEELPAVETAPPATSTETAPAAVAAAPALGSPPRLQLPAMGSSTPPVTTVESTQPVAEPPAAVVATDESAYGYGAGAADAPPTAEAASTAPVNPPSMGAPPATEMPTAETPAASVANLTPAPITPATVESVPHTPAPVTPAPTAIASSTPLPPQGATETDVVPDVTAAEPVGAPPIADAASTAASADTSALPIEDAGPTEPIELGTYLDGKNVLLRFDSQAGAWYRMTPRAVVHPGDKLLALPAFFPKLTLVSGLHIKLVGGTMITFGPTAAASDPAITIDYGQVVLVNTTNDETGLKLTIGGETSDIRLGRNATLAVDVQPKYVPGLDPRKSPSPVVAAVFTRDGDVTWGTAAGSNSIPAPAHWTIEDGLASAHSTDAQMPEWIDQEPVEQKSEKLFGAPAVEAALDPTRPVGEQLLELYESSRRREVKSLVARSSVYAGLFVPFVEALRDSDQKSAWKMHIDTLRTAMSLGPESADKIYQTLVDQRGKAAADDLYQMLCGYSAEEIGAADEFRTGLGTLLVDRMEDDSLDYRVLAVQDMVEISGMRLMPNPAGSPTERARGIRLWRQRLKSGEVAPVKQ